MTAFGEGLHGYVHAAPTGAKSVVIVCHGVHQHGGMYANFARRLVSEGFATIVYDLRGFGKSDGARGMTADGSFGQAVDDLRAVVADARRQYSRVFVFGHSLGGLIACLMATGTDAPTIEGYILSSPSVAVAPPLRLIGPLLACVPGNRVLANYELDSGSSNAAFKASWQKQPDHLCDPSRPFKAAYVRQARAAQLATRRHFARFAGDALILSGGLDLHEHDHGACADLYAALVARGASTGRAPPTLKVYPTKKHELIFEDGYNEDTDDGIAPHTNQVVDDIVAWLKERPASLW